MIKKVCIAMLVLAGLAVISGCNCACKKSSICPIPQKTVASK